MFERSRGWIVRFVSVALVAMGFMQVSAAGMIGTAHLVESDARAESLESIESLFARAAVAEELKALGVDAAVVSERLRGLSTSELVALEGRLHTETAGGDALGIIGAVFLVLLILELVGVTDIFKAI